MTKQKIKQNVKNVVSSVTKTAKKQVVVSISGKRNSLPKSLRLRDHYGPDHTDPCRPFQFITIKKECACNAGDLSLIPGSGRCPGEGDGNPLQNPLACICVPLFLCADTHTANHFSLVPMACSPATLL